ncbi:MAG: Ribosomal RNA large subunit methyltransferase I [Syntrophus sp. PtaB.Bin001]|nr:MAG: Ribosomal RNA large subunit methyltransferase I [Syntrophus sp. PtaB.Bin001]
MKTYYPRLFLKPGREKALLHGHPWIFSGAIASVEGKPLTGDVVTATDATGKFLGLGFYNPNSDITFRLLTKKVEDRLDASFWRNRIRFALALRQQIIPPDKTTAYRLINAEGDMMPGLIVDRYNDYLVCSLATAGMEKIRELIFDGLHEACKPKGIYERSEGRARKLEGHEERIGWLYGGIGEFERISVRENNLEFEVDIIGGQKTGFFLDQRINREAVGALSRGLKILNCFSYTGAFSIYAARGGASQVVSVDLSEGANAMARLHLGKNGFSPDCHPVVRADVFSWLRETEETFDAIILDPPAFAKTRKDIARSARGYKDINLQAMKHLGDGGLLWTFSCSNFMDEALFQKVVLGAAQDAGKNIQLLKILGPGSDHPTSLAHLEGRYLKGLLLRVYS